MIRVWIETTSAVTRAGLESLLAGGEGIELAGSVGHADVVLRDELPEGREEPPGGPDGGYAPTVVLSDEPVTPRVLRWGVHAVLPRDAPAEQIVASLYAAAAGLLAVPWDVARLVLAADPEPLGESLTPRETEALEMLAEGLSNKQIAARLNISEHTAKFHVNSILSKLGAGTRTEAVMRGLRSGLLKV
jgi:two-component system, NarL family, nitrate/nitrite response regulator NarL